MIINSRSINKSGYQFNNFYFAAVYFMSIRMTVSGQDGRTSYRTGTPGRGAIFNIEKINNNEKNGKKTSAEMCHFRIKSLLSNKNTDLSVYSPYLCVRSDGQLSFENISENNGGYSCDFYLKIIPEIEKSFETNNETSANKNENKNKTKN